MNLREALNWLSEIRESLEEMKAVKATGQTGGYLPGVSKKAEKERHFKRFPEKTARETKARAEKQRAAKAMTRGGQEVKPISQAQAHAQHTLQPKKKKGLIGRAVAKLKGESLEDLAEEIRFILEGRVAPPPIGAKARAAMGKKPLPTRGGAQPPRGMKRKGEDPNSEVGQALAHIKKMNRSDTEKALDDIKALNKKKMESIVFDIRSILEGEGERYGGGGKLSPRERAAKGLGKVNQLRRLAPPRSKGGMKNPKLKKPMKVAK